MWVEKKRGRSLIHDGNEMSQAAESQRLRDPSAVALLFFSSRVWRIRSGTLPLLAGGSWPCPTATGAPAGWNREVNYRLRI